MLKRLTKKETNSLASNGYHKCDYLLNGTPKYKAINKLGQLEDIEKELGIDLITLFDKLKNGLKNNGTRYDVVLVYDLDHYRLAEVDEGGFGLSWSTEKLGKKDGE